jgi:hypothetical protein
MGYAPEGKTYLIDVALRADGFESALPLEAFGPLRMFQKRSVSSAAALTIVRPSGDCAMCSTRDVWPVSSAP